MVMKRGDKADSIYSWHYNVHDSYQSAPLLLLKKNNCTGETQRCEKGLIAKGFRSKDSEGLEETGAKRASADNHYTFPHS